MVDRLRNSEANTRRIQNVESAFGNSGYPLLQPGRVLVGEGVLVKMCRKKPKARQFFLFSDLLVYGSILLSKKRYSKQHVIPLEDVKLENLEDEGDARNGWLIKTRTKSFVVYAATPIEKREWMQHIGRCVQELINNGKLPPADYAALWIPDKEAVKCMCCQTSHFTVIQRRHHCRACGKVVCAACSSKSFILQGISKKPVRVCDTCYNKLCQGMRTQPIANAMFGGGGHRQSSSSGSIIDGATTMDDGRMAAVAGGEQRCGSPITTGDSSESDGDGAPMDEEAECTEPTFYDPTFSASNNSTAARTANIPAAAQPQHQQQLQHHVEI